MNDLPKNKVIIGAISSVAVVFIVCLTVILVTASGVKKSAVSGNGSQQSQETTALSEENAKDKSDDDEEGDKISITGEPVTRKDEDNSEYSYKGNTTRTTAYNPPAPPAYYPPAGVQSNSQMDDSYIFPSDTAYLTYDILSNYSRAEIRYITNEMYARHGKIFTQEPYKSYFASKSWYYGTDTSMEVVRARFNDIEAENLETIADYERMKGWREPKKETTTKRVTTTMPPNSYDIETQQPTSGYTTDYYEETTAFEEPIQTDDYKSFVTGTTCRIRNTTPYHDGLNLRSEASKNSELLATLPEGTVFEVQADYDPDDNSYLYVSYYDDATGETILGWIFGPYLEEI